MSLFGPREEDPLLQNDPFAPDSNTDEASPSDNRDAAEEPPSGDGAPPPEPPSASQTEEAGSVFETEGAVPFRADDNAETRVIVRSAEEAAGGSLDTLNSSFERGWFLDRVELREAQPTETDPPVPSFALAFVLQRPRPR